MIIKRTSYTTSYLSGMVGSWLAIFVEDGRAGVGPISDVHVNNVLVLSTGGSKPLISGVAGGSVSNVTFRNIYLKKTGSAASLTDLELENLNFAENITLENDGGKQAETEPAAQTVIGEPE